MKQLLTYDDVAELCKMSKSWVMKQRRLGKITPLKFGPMVRFTEVEIERFLNEWRRGTVGDFGGTLEGPGESPVNTVDSQSVDKTVRHFR